jgi:hypothetical protein
MLLEVEVLVDVLVGVVWMGESEGPFEVTFGKIYVVVKRGEVCCGLKNKKGQ